LYPLKDFLDGASGCVEENLHLELTISLKKDFSASVGAKG
jgi:hypothetical protein